MKFGLHMPLKGGFAQNVNRVAELGYNCLQIFPGNPKAWKLSSVPGEELERRRLILAGLNIYPLVIHAAYLVNLSSAKELFLRRSCELMQATMERAAAYGAPYVVMHVGSHGGRGFDAGMELFISTLQHELKKWPSGVTMLLENTAGGGSSLGGKFAYLGHILKELDPDAPVGICLDTAHAWAAGYDLSSAAGMRESMEGLFAAVGFNRVKAIHANNITSPRGSHRDRHIHLRDGLIPPEAYTVLLEYAWPENFPVIMETPETGTRWDEINLHDLRAYAGPGMAERGK